MVSSIDQESIAMARYRRRSGNTSEIPRRPHESMMNDEISIPIIVML